MLVKKKTALKTKLKKVWDFIWYEDSIASWVVNILLAFILIKFIIYPLLGLLLGTSLPIVAVVSESMEHTSSFEDWWNSPAYCQYQICTQKEFYESKNITEEKFKKFIFENGFNKGDIIILYRANSDKLKVGDVITFNSLDKNTYPIIHRIIEINQINTTYIYQTKGDNNARQIFVEGHLDEYNIKENDLVGKGILKIPYLGYVKLIFTDFVGLFSK